MRATEGKQSQAGKSIEAERPRTEEPVEAEKPRTEETTDAETTQLEEAIEAGKHQPDEAIGGEKPEAEDAWASNPYFFTNSISQVEYWGSFAFDDFVDQDVKLNIIELAGLGNGMLYELKLDPVPGVPEDRLSLGYFYVQADKIYKIEPSEENLNRLKTGGELPEGSVIVCQDEEIKDSLSGDEPGFHHWLEANGAKREYRSYNNLAASGYYESFIWEKGKGLTGYRSGFGAERGSIDLQLREDF